MTIAAQRLAPGVQLGISEAMIENLVQVFYAGVRRDPILGPIFERVIAPAEWPPHLAKLVDFWSSVLLMSGRFKGSPMTAHLAIGGLGPTEFARWLLLFRQTAKEIWPVEASELIIAKSEIIGRSLQLGIETQREKPCALAS